MKAVIFDMDGVLVDSEYCMRTAAIQALSEWGIQAEHEDFFPFVGAGEDRFVGGVAEKHGADYEPAMKARAYAIYLDICDEHVVRFERIPETFAGLTAMGLKTAIASAADLIKVDANIRVLGIDPQNIGAIVTGSDVAKKKPDPACFLLAANNLGVEPEDCFVIEDAINGVKAARNAGMIAIGVTTSFSAEELTKAGAHYTVAKTKDIIPIISKLQNNVQ